MFDKENNTVGFTESTHEYINKANGKRCISVTTLIHKFTQPFDEQFWSSYKALEKLIDKDRWKEVKKRLLDKKRITEDILNLVDPSQFIILKQEILKEYDEKRKTACERGTAIHAFHENGHYDQNTPELKQFGLGGKFVCKKNYRELDLDKGVYPEFLIHRQSNDEILQLAGQIDLLIKDGNNIIIADYKTNKKLDQKSYFDTKRKQSTKMLYPLNNLMDCNMVHYQLQLSTYAWMLQKYNPDFVIKDLVIIHYDHDGNVKSYSLEYLKNDVERMLKYYKTKIKTDLEYEKLKDISY